MLRRQMLRLVVNDQIRFGETTSGTTRSSPELQALPRKQLNSLLTVRVPDPAHPLTQIVTCRPDRCHPQERLIARRELVRRMDLQPLPEQQQAGELQGNDAVRLPRPLTRPEIRHPGRSPRTIRTLPQRAPKRDLLRLIQLSAVTDAVSLS